MPFIPIRIHEIKKTGWLYQVLVQMWSNWKEISYTYTTGGNGNGRTTLEKQFGRSLNS